MNPAIYKDLDRQHLAHDTANNIKNLQESVRNVSKLHEELLDVNLSIGVYVKESKELLEALRLESASKAKNSFEQISIMSNTPTTPIKRRSHLKRNFSNTLTYEDNNNVSNKILEHAPGRTFAMWYKSVVDHDRYDIGAYLADGVVLEWFGRTIRTRKKVFSFMKYDMQCSNHDFTTIESKHNIALRGQIKARSSSSSEDQLASPLKIDGRAIIKDTSRKRPGLRSSSKSPQWETGCQSNEECFDESPDRKRLKTHLNQTSVKHSVDDEFRHPEKSLEVSFKEDGVPNKVRRKCLSATPPNKELGQGDCLPSTSGTDSMSDMSHSFLYAQLPRRVVECNGYIEFTRTRSRQSTHSMKWERKCKLQILYSDDPLNVGEYVIWAIYYSDDSKCRRNLLSAFEELAS